MSRSMEKARELRTANTRLIALCEELDDLYFLTEPPKAVGPFWSVKHVCPDCGGDIDGARFDRNGIEYFLDQCKSCDYKRGGWQKEQESGYSAY